MVLLVVLVQRPQDRLLLADGLQFGGGGHRVAEFLLLVLVALRFLPEGPQAGGHAVLAGGALAAQVRHEAYERGGQPAFSKRGPGSRPRALPTSRAAVSAAARPSHGHKNNDLGAWGGEARLHKGDDRQILC